MASADDQEELLDGEPDEGMDDLGTRLGLALVAGLGALLGAATSGGLWMFYPPVHGEHWPLPVIAVVSVLALGAAYALLRRRLGSDVADWFALGYVLALVGFTTIVAGNEALQFVRDRVAAVPGA